MEPHVSPPEYPFADYEPPRGPLRFLANIREHAFALVLVATLLGVVFAFRAFRQADRRRTNELAEAARASVQALQADGAALLTISTYPEGAEAFLDGRSIGLTPLNAVTVPPGRYRLTVHKPDFAPVDSVLDLAGGAAALVALPLDAAPMPSPEVAVATPRDRLPEAARPAARTRQQGAEPQASPAASLPPPQVPPARVLPADVRNPATGRLELRSEPIGAAVWLDQRFVGYTPVTLASVEPGEHVLSFRKLGFESPTTLVVLQGGQTLTLSPTLNALEGTLRVLAKPWGSIYINGELVQENTNIRFTKKLAPGQYRITVVHPVLGRWETFATIQAGRDASYVVDFNKGATADLSPEPLPDR